MTDVIPYRDLLFLPEPFYARNHDVNASLLFL
jgi:hypothetical protein